MVGRRADSAIKSPPVAIDRYHSSPTQRRQANGEFPP